MFSDTGSLSLASMASVLGSFFGSSRAFILSRSRVRSFQFLANLMPLSWTSGSATERRRPPGRRSAPLLPSPPWSPCRACSAARSSPSRRAWSRRPRWGRSRWHAWRTPRPRRTCPWRIGRGGLVHQLLDAGLLGLVGLEDAQPLGLDLGAEVLVLHLDVEGGLVLLGQLDGDLEATDHRPRDGLGELGVLDRPASSR